MFKNFSNSEIIQGLKSGGGGKTATPTIRATEQPNKPIEVEDQPKNISGKRQHWGYHLILDVSECSHGIDDPAYVVQFIKELVVALKMKPIGEPIVVKVDDAVDGRGTSAVQIITTSTITFHGDDDEWSAYIDVFSCAPYDPKVAIDLVHKYFQPKHVGDIWLYRDAGSWPRK